MSGKPGLTVPEAAEGLGGVSIQLIYRLFERGELEGFRVGSCIRIFPESIAAYIEAHRNIKPADQSTPSPKRAAKQRRRQAFEYQHLRRGTGQPVVAG
jgi:excisionase family DNA binding protein